MGCHCTTRGASRARQLIPLTATELPWTWGSKICDELLRKGLRRVEPLFSGDVLDLGCGAMPYRSVLGARAQRWIGLDRPIAAAGRPAADVFGAATALHPVYRRVLHMMLTELRLIDEQISELDQEIT